MSELDDQEFCKDCGDLADTTCSVCDDPLCLSCAEMSDRHVCDGCYYDTEDDDD